MIDVAVGATGNAGRCRGFDAVRGFGSPAVVVRDDGRRMRNRAGSNHGALDVVWHRMREDIARERRRSADPLQPPNGKEGSSSSLDLSELSISLRELESIATLGQ